MTRILTSLSAALLLFVPGAALAHPGHGQTEHPVAHHLIEPEHAIVLAAAAVAAVALFWARRAAVARRRR